MLIYEKVVESDDEVKRALYGTMGNIPMEDDEPIVYKDSGGNEIEDVSDIKYVYEKDNTVYASTNATQVPDEANDFEFSAWLGEVNILSHNEIFEVNHNEVDGVVILPKSGTAVTSGTTIRILLSPEKGETFSDTPTLTIAGKAVELTADDDSYYADVVVEEDIYFEVGVSEAKAISTKGTRKAPTVDDITGCVVTYTKPKNVTVTPKSGDTFEFGATVDVTLAPAEGKTFTETPFVWVNGEPAEVVATDSGFATSFVIINDTELTFSTHTTAITE